MEHTNCPLKKGITSKKKRTEYILSALEKIYPQTACGLEFSGDPFRLLVMARLSAQCTDKRVNMVSEQLFKVLPDPKSMAQAPIEVIENLIKSCGLYHTKAGNIKDMSQIIYRDYGGEVPSDIDRLLELPGVGRKIANLIRGDVFGLGGIVADTHCIRLSHRWGLTSKADPLCTERELEKLIEKSRQSDFCHRAVEFGREYCSARGPKCENCPLVKEL